MMNKSAVEHVPFFLYKEMVQDSQQSETISSVHRWLQYIGDGAIFK